MTLTYSFDSRMGLYDETSKTKTTCVSDLKYLYDMYKASMIRAREFGYKIKLYGDSITISNLKEYIDSSYCIDNIKFDLVDDLKIWIHTQNDLDCITFDGDIILTSRLDFMNDFGYDAIFENKETKKNVLNKEWDSYNGYVTMLEIFEKYNTDKLVKNYTNTNTFSCNVGVIKFNNQSTKDALISGYYEMKNHYLNNIEPIDNLRKKKLIPSLIICQYHFANTIESNKFNVGFLSESNGHRYSHWVGGIKFYKVCIQEVYNILNDVEKTSFI
jgi:hypothetical protein